MTSGAVDMEWADRAAVTSLSGAVDMEWATDQLSRHYLVL